ncbi:MAG: glycosyltransferase family 39 protein [Patescibacteria group bacterium]
MYKFFNKVKIKFHSFDFNIVTILFSALIFRLFIANFSTLQLDQGTFIAWANSLVSGGFSNFYNDWSDYFPGYLYILWGLGKLNLIFPTFQTILFKLPAIFADIATGYIIYRIVGEIKGNKFGMIASSLYVFNPAIFANSSLWGQVDSLTALFSLFSVFVFPVSYRRSRPSYAYHLSAISLAIGTLMKPQAAFILPAIIYLLIRSDKNRSILYRVAKSFAYSSSSLVIFVLGFLPFNNKSNFFDFVIERFSVSSGQYPYGSVNAFSFWGLFGFWKPDNITFWIGLSISIILIIFSTLIILKKKIQHGEYLIAGLSLLITFLFMTRMHERHLLPALAPLLVSASIYPVILISYFGLSLTYVANLSYAYNWITHEYKEIFNPFLVKTFIVANISFLILIIVNFFKKLSFKFNFKKQIINSRVKQFATKDVSDKSAKIILSIILLFSILTRVYALGAIKEMYFDEIYHAFTAKLVLHNDPKAWEWWNPHPEGFAYEWTHPPISKLGMVVGMKLFGENSFGWRIPQAIMGTLSILLVYFLALEIFKDRKIALLSSAIFSLDGLLLVLSRMGMNDTYVLFFSLLSILLFIKNKNILSFVSFGLALASKWSAIYTLPILFVSYFVFKKKISVSYVLFLVIPMVVYVASYGVMFATGHTWDQFIEVQKQMWWYHTSLVAEHPYTSPAWSWPLLLRPIYLYDGQVVNNLVARIYAFGNPFVFWFGLFSIIFSMIISAMERNKKLGFVVFSYLIFFLPWIASPRIMFLYHYLPSIPFMVIASAFVLRRFPKASVYFLVSSFLCFVYFYPHWIGLRIPVWLDESYYWINSWR